MSDETAIISDVNFNAEMRFCILNVVPRGIHEKRGIAVRRGVSPFRPSWIITERRSMPGNNGVIMLLYRPSNFCVPRASPEYATRLQADCELDDRAGQTRRMIVIPL